ncbi:MAG: hypothetical protein E6J90_32460, partial [Deltaproteobacteria bacterium]
MLGSATGNVGICGRPPGANQLELRSLPSRRRRERYTARVRVQCDGERTGRAPGAPNALKSAARGGRDLRAVAAGIALVLALARGAAAQPDTSSAATSATGAQPPRPRLLAARTSTAPDIDGDLRDAAWQRATPTTAFTQKFPDEAQPPSEPTELRVLYDDGALYVAFDCTQVTAPVRGRLARRDRQVEADWIQVAIDDGASTYEFSVNAAGVLSDGVRFNDTDYSADWDGVWDAQVKRTERGWAAELRLPLRIFRHSIGSAEWGFQARRYISQRQETDEWAYIPRSMAGEVSHYGWLSGMADVRRSNPLELLPYVAAGTHWSDMSPGGRVVSDFGYRATVGLDLAWRVGADLTLDASFNPDFAQVEADQLVLNLTTFETFFPEKRPFFVNGMAMFQMPRMELFPTPQTLFYTRRIGAAPAAPAASDDSQVAAPEPSTIYAAAKLSGQLVSGISLGLVSAVMGRNDVTAQPSSGPARALLAEPLDLANVARIKVGIGQGAHIGVMATALQRFEPDHAYPTVMQPGGMQLQVCPDGSSTPVGARCFHDGYVAGLDSSWRSTSGSYVVAGQALVTSIQNGPPRGGGARRRPARRLQRPGLSAATEPDPDASVSGLSHARPVLGDRRDRDPCLRGDARQPRWREAAARLLRRRQGAVQELLDPRVRRLSLRHAVRGSRGRRRDRDPAPERLRMGCERVHRSEAAARCLVVDRIAVLRSQGRQFHARWRDHLSAVASARAAARATAHAVVGRGPIRAR